MIIAFDQWSEVDPKKTYEFPSDRIMAKCNRDADFYISKDGVELLITSGKELDVRVDGTLYSLRVDCPKDARVFFALPYSQTVQSGEETWTNIDRQPNESGAYYEVQRALRQMRLEEMAKAAARRKARKAEDEDSDEAEVSDGQSGADETSGAEDETGVSEAENVSETAQ